MANKKINELVTRTPSLTDLILVGDPSSGYSYKATVTALATIIETDIADGFVTLSTTQTISGAKTFTNAVLISANSPELNLNQGTSSASYINFKENSSLVNRIISSGATLTFITNNSGTAALVLSSSQTATFGSIPNATTDTDRFLVSDSGTLKYRTGAELLSDIGAASSSNISGTTNYIAKFTSSSAIGNSVIYESGGNIGISTTSLSAKLNVNGNAILTGSINATEVYLASPNGLVFQIDSSNTNGGYAEFQTNSTTIGRIGTATQVVGSGGTSVFAISSRGANDFVLGTNGTERVRIDTSGNVTFSQIANATTDTDKFLVSDSGVLKYRTGSELLSDIGGASSSSISGTTNYIPKFTSSSAIGNSIMYEGTNAIGIGTTSPNTYSGYTALTINNSSTGALLDLDVADVRTATIATTVSEFTLGSITNIPIAFITNSSERMRLDASGNLGINTSSPSYKLDVSGSGRFTGNLGINGVGPTYPLYVRTGTNQRFRIVDGGSGYTQLASLDDAESAYTPIMIGNSWVNINASGNLGLGVTPSAWGSGYTALQVKNSGFMSNDGNLWMYANGYFDGSSNKYIQNGYASRYYQYNSGHYWDIAPSGTAGNAISFTQAMTLDASGRLGIGTTSPASTLSVYSTAATNVLQLVEQGTSGRGSQIQIKNAHNTGYYLGLSGDTNGDVIQYNGGNTNMIFYTNALERMRITSGGNVLVNKTNNGTGAVQVKHTDTNFYTGLSVYGTTADNFTSVGHTGSLGVISSTYNSTGSYTPLAFYTSDLERMRIKSTGQVRFVPLASDPTGAESGDVYYNSTTNKLKVYNGTAWTDLH